MYYGEPHRKIDRNRPRNDQWQRCWVGPIWDTTFRISVISLLMHLWRIMAMCLQYHKPRNLSSDLHFINHVSWSLHFHVICGYWPHQHQQWLLLHHHSVHQKDCGSERWCCWSGLPCKPYIGRTSSATIWFRLIVETVKDIIQDS